MKETFDNQLEQIWQSQPVEGMKMSADVIRLRATKFERKISRRNLNESVGGILAIGGFLYFFVTTHDIALRVTWGLFIAGMIWIIISLHLKGTPRTMPSAMGSSSCLEFFRSELARQRDLIKNVWPWHLAPLVPGYVALNVAYALAFRKLSGWIRLGLLDVFFVALFIGIWKMNQRKASCFQRTIDELSTK